MQTQDREAVLMNDATLAPSVIEEGDPHTTEQLLPLVYDELKKLAASKLAQETPGQTLQATALVHEAYLRLLGSSGEIHWSDRRQFFMAAAEVMRRILVDNARRKLSIKHGGGWHRCDVDAVDADALATTDSEPEPDVDLAALDMALNRLAEFDPEKAKLVELRYFAGLTGDQAAAVLGISPSSGDRQWVYTRAWLRRELSRTAES
jgi:RNA polymerase sigma factor (TIGR02999 family)